MSTKTKVIGVRVDQEVDRRLLDFEANTGIERVTLARNALLAALDFYEANGRITFPLQVIEGAVVPKKARLDAEEIARLRPQDRGTPVLKTESGPSKVESPTRL
jgi:hypothetical protein